MKEDTPESRYISLVTHFKILSSNATKNNKIKDAKIYSFIAKKLEDIREQRHLSLIGSKDIKRTKYQNILELLNNDLSIEQLVLEISKKFSNEEINSLNNTKGESR